MLKNIETKHFYTFKFLSNIIDSINVFKISILFKAISKTIKNLFKKKKKNFFI
jgi:hypothetical protein